MKFTIVIMQADSLEARVVVSTLPGETSEALAARAKSELLENAGRLKAARSQTGHDRVRAAQSQPSMTEATLNAFAELFETVVRAQAEAGTSRFVTAYTRGGDDVFHAEGQIALLGSASDFTCLIDVVDDESMARKGN